MGWVHHIDITVSDLEVSTAFYDQVLKLMGFRLFRGGGEVHLWVGDRMEVGLQQARPEQNRNHDRYSPALHHLAFGSPDRAAVDCVYLDIVGTGREDLGCSGNLRAIRSLILCGVLCEFGWNQTGVRALARMAKPIAVRAKMWPNKGH
jgi:catechol 2,3-dioxygenase-like lactoylglutathione lyase family enzyme